MEILPVDRFVIINQTILTETERKTLIMLYQPIIGFTAVNLYITLWTLLEKNEITSDEYDHTTILENMKISILEFIEAKDKLEALGLIKTYLKEKDINSYVYELYSPTSASDFLNNPILNTLLYSNIDKKRYKKIVEYYTMPKIDLKGYKNVTKNLFDVFEIGAAKTDTYNEIRKTQRNSLTMNPTIDLNTIFSLIPNELLNKRLVTKNIKDSLINYSFVYGFDNEEMKNIIFESVVDGKIDLKKFEEKALEYYQFENYGNMPNLIDKTQPEYLRKKNTTLSNKDKMIYQYETTTPHEYLRLKYNDGKVSKYDVETLKILLNDIKLMPGVVNVLIDYVLRINNNKLSRNFVEAIASQWKRENIVTVEGAMEISKRENKTKKTSSKKVASIPSYLKEDEPKNTNLDDLREVEEILKDYR